MKTCIFLLELSYQDVFGFSRTKSLGGFESIDNITSFVLTHIKSTINSERMYGKDVDINNVTCRYATDTTPYGNYTKILYPALKSSPKNQTLNESITETKRLIYYVSQVEMIG